MDKTTFDLEATSAAILFHQDMSTELVLPKMADSEQVDFEAHQNLFIAMATASLFDDAQFRAFVQARLETMLEATDAVREDDENVVEGEIISSTEPEDCPPGGCGCCGGHKDPGDGS